MQLLAPHTVRELHIIADRAGEKNTLDFFDCTKSQGGRDLLRKMVLDPKPDLNTLLAFQDTLRLIAADVNQWDVNISSSYIAAVENYYSSSITYSMSQDVFMHFFDTMLFSWKHPHEFDLVRSGLSATILLIQEFKITADRFGDTLIPSLLADDFEFLTSFFQQSTIKLLVKIAPHEISKSKVLYLDYYLRIKQKKTLRRILDIFYSLDAYTSIAKKSIEHGLIFPDFTTESAVFEANKLWQPFIPNAISNDFTLKDAAPLCLLTGANTSGKTTFLKTCGLVAYLAHLGWPVPAKSLRISFFDKLFTSIHLSDDLDLGYSHFYNEVMRIKEIALALKAKESCLVIIDELFRGTNTADALFCSKIVIDGFIHQSNSLFVVSTHLLEILPEFEKSGKIVLHCFQTNVKEADFENTFKITPGIAREKIGRMILEKTGVVNLLSDFD